MYVPAIIIFLCSTCSFVCWELKVNMMWCAASRVGLLVCTRSSQTTPMSSHLVLVAQSIWGPESFTYGIDEIFLKHSASSPPESMTSQPQMGYCCKNPFKHCTTCWEQTPDLSAEDILELVQTFITLNETVQSELLSTSSGPSLLPGQDHGELSPCSTVWEVQYFSVRITKVKQCQFQAAAGMWTRDSVKPQPAPNAHTLSYFTGHHFSVVGYHTC